MASKEQELPNFPTGVANGHAHRDTEAASHDAREQRRKKRQKCILYIVLFIIFQSAVIAVFSLTIMKIRTPKFSVVSATRNNFNVTSSTTNPSFNTSMTVHLHIKNSNFGRYKYRDTTVYFLYRGVSIGEVSVSGSYAKWKSTKRFVVAVDLNSAGVRTDPNLVSDLNNGIVPISSHAELRGKVALLYVMKKSKAIAMNCNMEILTGTREIGNIVCN